MIVTPLSAGAIGTIDDIAGLTQWTLLVMSHKRR